MAFSLMTLLRLAVARLWRNVMAANRRRAGAAEPIGVQPARRGADGKTERAHGLYSCDFVAI
jgi:hypothetical protein